MLRWIKHKLFGGYYDRRLYNEVKHANDEANRFNGLVKDFKSKIPTYEKEYGIIKAKLPEMNLARERYTNQAGLLKKLTKNANTSEEKKHAKEQLKFVEEQIKKISGSITEMEKKQKALPKELDKMRKDLPNVERKADLLKQWAKLLEQLEEIKKRPGAEESVNMIINKSQIEIKRVQIKKELEKLG